MRYKMSFADSIKHIPKHLERTAKRTVEWDVEFRVFISRDSMLIFLNKQNAKPPHRLNWFEYKTRGEK